jgi:drug/metabolite transporter (DMT)-like permease
LGEAPSRDAWAAIALGMVGVVLVAQPHVTQEAKLPALAALTSSLSTSISMLGLHRLQGIDARAIVVHFSAVSLAACLACLLMRPLTALAASHFEPATIWMLLGVGVCATIGQLFLTKAFAAGPPAKVSVIALTQVGFGMLFDVVVEQHSFELVSRVGIVLVMAPAAWLLVTQGRLQTDDL